MIEAQALEYKDTDDSDGPKFPIYFPEHKDAIQLPVKKVIETAFNALKSSSTEPGFYRKQCWEVIKSYLVAALQVDDDKSMLLKLLSHTSFRDGPIHSIHGPQYRCPDKQARSVHQMAVTGMFGELSVPFSDASFRLFFSSPTNYFDAIIIFQWLPLSKNCDNPCCPPW